MYNLDKTEVRNKLTIDDIFGLLNDFGGDPEYTDFGILSSTICHNPPGQGSRKLYFYSNSMLFYCYSGCEEPSFDIFQLVIKVFDIQHEKRLDLNDAVRYIAARFGIIGTYEDNLEDELEDWKILANYERIESISIDQKSEIVLKEYDSDILSRFNYNLKLTPWLKEGIAQEAIDNAKIGFYPGGDQITIPHFDQNGRFIGLRGRTLSQMESELYGKYRPIKIGNILYSHPLGMNLYGLNWAKQNISTIKKAIVVESEKSVLKYASYFGWENNICVACCGSSLSAHQVQMLLDAGVEEIVVGLDRQFQQIGDEEFKKLKTKLIKLNNKYKNYVNISLIFDKNMITAYKNSPLDEGKDKFLQLFKERIIL